MTILFPIIYSAALTYLVWKAFKIMSNGWGISENKNQRFSTASFKQKNYTIKHCERILNSCVYGMPSVDPKHKKFESERYWRGPVWSIMNYMISHGLEHEGEYSLAKRIKDDTIKLIEVGGMYEYFNPHTGKGLGGHDFSWTAAILLALGRDSSNLKFTNN